MTKIDRIVSATMFLAMLGSAEAAMAGVATPAPIAGVGIGAVILLGAGYRLLRKRIGR